MNQVQCYTCGKVPDVTYRKDGELWWWCRRCNVLTERVHPSHFSFLEADSK